MAGARAWLGRRPSSHSRAAADRTGGASPPSPPLTRTPSATVRRPLTDDEPPRGAARMHEQPAPGASQPRSQPAPARDCPQPPCRWRAELSTERCGGRGRGEGSRVPPRQDGGAGGAPRGAMRRWRPPLQCPARLLRRCQVTGAGASIPGRGLLSAGAGQPPLPGGYPGPLSRGRRVTGSGFSPAGTCSAPPETS